MDTIRIDQLAGTSFPNVDHELPAMRGGVTVKLTVAQILSLLSMEVIDDRVASLLLASGLATVTYNDAGNTLTVGVAAASQAEAEAGSASNRAMTPQRTAQALASSLNDRGERLLSSGTTGADATCDITIPAGFRAYRLVAQRFEPLTAGSLLNIRFDQGSGFVASNNYQYALGISNHDSVASQLGGNLQSSILLSSGLAAQGGAGTLFDLTIHPGGSGNYPSISHRGGYLQNTGPLWCQVNGAGRLIVAGLISAVRLLFSSGNIGAGGQWQLYGMRN